MIILSFCQWLVLGSVSSFLICRMKGYEEGTVVGGNICICWKHILPPSSYLISSSWQNRKVQMQIEKLTEPCAVVEMWRGTIGLQILHVSCWSWASLLTSSHSSSVNGVSDICCRAGTGSKSINTEPPAQCLGIGLGWATWNCHYLSILDI